MPLAKRIPEGTANQAGAIGATATLPAVTPATTPPPTVTAPKAAPAAVKARAAKAGNEVPLTKETYWERKEERDIETGKRIRRSGVWQAALQAMAGLQFNQGGTIESYLELVDRLAEHGLGWVNKD